MQNVKISPTRIGHLNLFVSDVESSASFYTDVCGFQEVFREEAISMIFMSNGKTHHDLGLMEITPGDRLGRDGYKHSASKTPGLNHLGFEMHTEHELVEAYQRACTAHVKIGRTTDHQISKSIYMPDLDGHMFEFYADSLVDWKGFYANNTGSLISGPWEPSLATADKETRVHAAPEFHLNNAAVMQSHSVAYAGLPVSDLKAAIEFYEDVFGMAVTLRDASGTFAVLQGSGGGGCDIILVERSEKPSVRMLFGGVQLHDGKPLAESIKTLRQKAVPFDGIGEQGAESCIVSLDPDGIPLVYSTVSAIDLFRQHGADVLRAVELLLAGSENKQ